LRVEPVDAGRIRREPNRVALLQAELADGTCGDPVRLRKVDVQGGCAPQMLGGDDGYAPALTITARRDMLRPNPDRGRIHSRGQLPRHEIHAGRADETGDEEIVGPRVELEGGTHLLH